MSDAVLIPSSDLAQRAAAYAAGGELPSAWTPEHVGVRLVEAYQVLGRLPMKIWPKQYGNIWPEMLWEDESRYDINVQANLVEEARRARSLPSSAEISRMDEAIAWPAAHLPNSALCADAVTLWALYKAKDRSPFPTLAKRRKAFTAAAAARMADPARKARIIEKHKAEARAKRLRFGLALTARRDARIQEECEKAIQKEVMVRPEDVATDHVFTRSAFDHYRLLGLDVIAAGLRSAGVAVR